MRLRENRVRSELKVVGGPFEWFMGGAEEKSKNNQKQEKEKKITEH